MMQLLTGDEEQMKIALLAGADPSLRDEGGFTAMEVAATRHNIPLMLRLVENGAKPAASSSDGYWYTPFIESTEAKTRKWFGEIFSPETLRQYPKAVPALFKTLPTILDMRTGLASSDVIDSAVLREMSVAQDRCFGARISACRARREQSA